MKKVICSFVLAISLLFSSPLIAANFYPFSGALTGGGAGSLDGKDGATLALKDVAIVALVGDATYGDSTFIYVYKDFSGAVSEIIPFIIKPNTNPNANYAWQLVTPYAPIFIGGSKVTNKTSSTTLTAAECNGIISSNGAYTHKLPAVPGVVPIGTTVVIYSTGANIQTIDPDDTDGIIREGAARAANGVSITLSAGAGNYVVLFADSDSGWTTLGFKGTLGAGS